MSLCQSPNRFSLKQLVQHATESYGVLPNERKFWDRVILKSRLSWGKDAQFWPLSVNLYADLDTEANEWVTLLESWINFRIQRQKLLGFLGSTSPIRALWGNDLTRRGNILSHSFVWPNWTFREALAHSNSPTAHFLVGLLYLAPQTSAFRTNDDKRTRCTAYQAVEFSLAKWDRPFVVCVSYSLTQHECGTIKLNLLRFVQCYQAAQHPTPRANCLRMIYTIRKLFEDDLIQRTRSLETRAIPVSLPSSPPSALGSSLFVEVVAIEIEA